MANEKSEQLEPKEQKQLIKSDSKNFSIGIPKESDYDERRVALVPSTAKFLVDNGCKIIVERNCGDYSKFSDKDYADAGAIISEKTEVYKSDIILKIAPPSMQDISLMKERQVLISALHIKVRQKEYFNALSKKKIIAFSYEHIRDYTNSYPVMQSLSEITGVSAIMLGAKYLGDEKWGRAKMLGGFSGVNPSDVVLIGAGMVNQYAAKAALGLGANVKVFDNNINKLRNLVNNLNQDVFTSVLHPEVLSNALESCDLAVGAIYAPNGSSVNVVSEEMVQKMKEGSVIVDVSIDKGGCFSSSKITSHNNPVYKKYGITHYCVPNIPSRTPRTSSIAMSNHFGPMIYNLCMTNGLTEYLQKYKGACAGVYLFNGRLTHEYIAHKFELPYYNLELMIASMG